MVISFIQLRKDKLFAMKRAPFADALVVVVASSAFDRRFFHLHPEMFLHEIDSGKDSEIGISLAAPWSRPARDAQARGNGRTSATSAG